MPVSCRAKMSGCRLSVIGPALAVGLMLSPLGQATAANRIFSPDFESLYQGSMDQGSAEAPLNLNLGPAIGGVVPEIASGTQALAFRDPAGDRERLTDRAEDRGFWRVVPIFPKRQNDEDTTLIDDLTPLGLGFVRAF